MILFSRPQLLATSLATSLATCALFGLALHSPAALAQARGSTPPVSSQQIIDALKNPPPAPPPPATGTPSPDKRTRNFGIEANPDYVNRPAPALAPAAAPAKPVTAAAPAKPARPGAPAVNLNEPEEWPPRGTITMNKPDVPAAATAVAAARPSPSIDLALQFEYNSAKMTRDSHKTLLELAKALASPELAKLHFLVQGHTDGKGLPAYNMKLSQQRAEQVKRLLVQNKIAATRLTAEGKGASEPLDANNIEAAENRRVRIISMAR